MEINSLRSSSVVEGRVLYVDLSEDEKLDVEDEEEASRGHMRQRVKMNQEVPDSEVTFYLCHPPEELYIKASSGLDCLPRVPTPETITIREETFFTCRNCWSKFLSREKFLRHLQECGMDEDDEDFNNEEEEEMYDEEPGDLVIDMGEVGDYDDDNDEDGKLQQVQVLVDACEKGEGRDGQPHYICFDADCSKEFQDLRDLEEHLRVHIKEEIKFKCDPCSVEFDTEEELSAHEESHCESQMKPYACPNCGKKFRFKVSLTRHVKSVHRNEKRFACTYCEKPFFEKSNLVKHMRVHTDDRPYACEICEKRFRQANSLRVHMKIHTMQDRYQCGICYRSFPTELGLEKHLLRHKVVEGIKCNVCHLSFPTKSTLSKHMLTHTGERAFGCSVCEKRFYHKGHLTEHFRTHTGEKPFECKICDRRFTQRTALTQHNARFHMNGKPFRCVCGEGFPRKCDLKVHKMECPILG